MSYFAAELEGCAVVGKGGRDDGSATGRGGVVAVVAEG